MGLTGKSSIAILVLASKSPTGLSVLGEYCERARIDLYVHVDPKYNRLSFLEAAPSALFHPDPRPVFWRGFSMVEAAIRLLQFASAHAAYLHFLLLSDDTMPLAAPDQLVAQISNGADIIEAEERRNGLPIRRYAAFHLFDSLATTVRWVPLEEREVTPDLVKRMVRLQALRERGKKPLNHVYHGSQWWALTRSSVEAVLNSWENDNWLRESFEFTDVPDEAYIQTIVRSSKPNHASQALVLTDWSVPKPPRVFTDLADIRPYIGKALFIRKVELERKVALRFIDSMTITS